MRRHHFGLESTRCICTTAALVSAAYLGLDATPAYAQCPPANHNCYVTGGPGCTNAACCNVVCGVDPFCCNSSWDSICVNEALSMCGGCGNAASGACNSSHANPGCSDSTCCAAVCAQDPFCCDTQWDSICVNEANDICYSCGGVDPGDCFVAHPTTACNIPDCCEAVCAADPFCCDTSWDGICAGEAQTICATCGGAGAGSCFEAHPNPGCNNSACCNTVCATDPFCCDSEWDSICAGEAIDMCSCGGVDNGSCFAAHSTPACNNADCCAAVCAVDSFCCDTVWDGLCASEASTICATCGGAGAGNCEVAHPNPSCNNALCCQTVCAVDSFCCSVTWDSICANEAIDLCTGCGGVNSGSCFSTHDATCNNGACCASVCAIDPFCCNNSWDGICVNEAEDLCGCPGDIAPVGIGGDGVINTADLLQVINTWGACNDCPADIVPPGNNGLVNTADLLYIINHWGPCPGCGNPFICGEPPGQPVCGAGPPCFCWQGFYGDTVCAQNSLCGGLTLCPDGVCPPGFVCITNTCCNAGAATCLPVCGTLLDSRPQGNGPTANGEVWGLPQN